jgi:PhnB protein
MNMANTPTAASPGRVRPVPEGYHTVTPFVVVKGAPRLIDFMTAAFGATEMGRVAGEDGTISHAEVRVGDSVVMMFDAREGWPATPAFLRLYVAECAVTYQNALAAGAASVTRPTNMPWGDRVCRVRDPLGNLWWIMTRLEDVPPEEEARRWAQQEYLGAIRYVQGAQPFADET